MSAKRDRRRSDIARFLEVYRGFGAPAGNAAEQTVWILLQSHGTKEGATKASKALWGHLLDVNELRVSKATQIASVIHRHVKNDAVRVGEQLRGFLRRWHRDHHTIDFGIAARMTPDQVRKYLTSAEDHAREMALALFVHFCAVEEEIAKAEAAPPPEGEKPKKRPEKDITVAANRLRVFATISAHGSATCRTKLVNCAKCLDEAWQYAPLPPRGEAEAAPAAPAPAAPPTKTKTRKNQTKGGGTTRPRTTRTARRRTTKKSSRR